MGRWEPDARGRLQQAAWELFVERGYEQTTAAEIAKRAGLTERTFFRHFADKREAFFAGAGVLEERALLALDDVPAQAMAFDAVRAAVDAIAALLQDRTFSQQRQRMVNANPELQERERLKLASLAAAIAQALRKRGVNDTASSLAAEMGVAVFRIGFERWIGERETRSLTEVVRAGFDELKLVAAESS